MYTQALIGAWEAVLIYDAEQSTSLWSFAKRLVKYRTYDQARTELGRHLERSQVYIKPVDNDDLRFVACYEHGYDDIETEDLIASLLERLSPKYRELLQVIYLDEISMKDVSARLRITDCAVSVATKKARHRAKKIVCDMCEGVYPTPAQRSGSMLMADGMPVVLAWPEN
jgi:RNA polymerase sigma factor (sigma-70 family)